MKKFVLVVLAWLVVQAPAYAKLNVFACEPEWGALTRELAGDAAEVFVATSALQDPHHIQARPSLIAKIHRADMVVCTGADLEVGWLPVLLRRGANPKVLPGQPGYFEAAAHVPLLERPQRLDRSEGDVHPQGNPHIQTDPRNIYRVGQALAQRLMEIDPEHAAHYRVRWAAFSTRWQQAMQHWNALGAPLKGMPIVTHHKGWTYLVHWLQLNEVATLEPKPGIPPSSAHLQKLVALLKVKPARAIIRAPYQDPKPSEWLSAKTGTPAVVLPFTVGGTPQAKDLFTLFDDTLARLRKAAGVGTP
ncbi:zinc/manganese transport system substrate-binding protein [Sulfurivirga caldicuralii]|uniref:Zinc/manganese transport system substrate-binding protein n=1 Tax=Sulfurivirga caldicuralii TaxID=364032 RepID=A0A1N6GT58_9GAMM|nr:zinc ABC transporter substrate-binding protein [Sulfurivirga caldicuralii]SIO10754.1 zinc/manganese transport system substrate-binding protein [Sulfurivirga caldicuralii]